ncbi:YqeB family protein [Tenggerimyces flavus]|uniref:Uncharacterized protein n=1 Tax=Tenggerimyces flavus TaxID=1708749 RepID=A0ABV7Y5B7_9ACTN|nr:hypothetical protein [Tenggerimyces flavus]MBM7788474.1 hypothetical protein [Tenggerimyces flavus]
MTSNAAPRSDETVVRDPAWAALLMWVGLPVAGALVFWCLKQIADWVAGLPAAPFQGLFKLAASAPDPWATIGALVLGAIAGIVLALIGAHETLQLTVSDADVRMRRMDVPSSASRDAVGSVFLDGKRLVLLGPRGEEVASEKSELPRDLVRSAFVSHGYPWVDEDPYKDQYRLWVEDLPDLPPGANPVLKARAKALEKDSETDARELRGELVKLGVVVREQKKRQYIRVVA